MSDYSSLLCCNEFGCLLFIMTVCRAAQYSLNDIRVFLNTHTHTHSIAKGERQPIPPFT